MSEREARIRLSLSSDDFLSKMKSATDASKAAAESLGAALKTVEQEAGKAGSKGEDAGKKGKAAWHGWSTAAKAVKDDFTALGSQAKSLASTALTLGGAFTLGSALKNAVQTKSGFSDLAIQMELTTGKAVNWQKLQEKAQAAAALTTRTTDEMRGAMARVYDLTGEGEFAGDSMLAIGEAATATGKDVGDLAGVAAQLRRRFQAEAGDLPEMFERIFEKVGAGGPQFDQLVGELDSLGEAAQRAGLSGKEGLTLMLSSMKAMGKEGVSTAGFKTLLGALDDKAGGLRKLEMSLNAPRQFDIMQGTAKGIKLEGKDFQGKMSEILSHYSDVSDPLFDPGGMMKRRGGRVMAGFMDQVGGESSEAGKTVKGLIEPFEVAFKAARAEGKSVEQARKIGTAEFERSMKSMGESAATGSKLQAAAASKAAEPAAKLRQALETLQSSFADPKVVDAIEELAKVLPDLAKVVAQVVKFAVQNPALAVGGALAGRAAMTATVSLSQSAIQSAGTLMAQRFSAAVGASGGPWKTAGAALGIAAAAYLGYELGKMGVDAATKADQADITSQEDAIQLAQAALVSKDPADRAKAREAAQTALNAVEQGEGGGVFSGEGAIGKLGIGLGRALNVVTGGAAGLTEDDATSLADQRANREARLRRVITDLDAGGMYGAAPGAPAAGKPGEVDTSKAKEKEASSAERAARAADKLASSLDRAASSAGVAAGANGLPGRAGTGPGTVGQ